MTVPTQTHEKMLHTSHHLSFHKSASLLACVIPLILWASTAGFSLHWLYVWLQGGLTAGQATAVSMLLGFFLAMLLISLLGIATSILIYRKRWPLYWQGGLIVLGWLAFWFISGD